MSLALIELFLAQHPVYSFFQPCSRKTTCTVLTHTLVYGYQVFTVNLRLGQEDLFTTHKTLSCLMQVDSTFENTDT
jgi:hypothetical protein